MTDGGGAAGRLTGGGGCRSPAVYVCFCREKELAKVTIKKEDLELIVSRGGAPGGWWHVPNLGCSRRLVTGTAPKDDAVCPGPWCRAAPAADPPGPARHPLLQPL